MPGVASRLKSAMSGSKWDPSACERFAEVGMRNDVTFVVIILAMFAVMFGLVWVCDKIIGSDEQALREQGGAEPDPASLPIEDEQVAA